MHSKKGKALPLHRLLGTLCALGTGRPPVRWPPRCRFAYARGPGTRARLVNMALPLAAVVERTAVDNTSGRCMLQMDPQHMNGQKLLSNASQYRPEKRDRERGSIASTKPRGRRLSKPLWEEYPSIGNHAITIKVGETSHHIYIMAWTAHLHGPGPSICC